MLMTMFVLFGSGLLFNDLNVMKPIITGEPKVVFLKYFISPGRFHRRAFFLPIAQLSATATMMHFSMIPNMLTD